MLYQVTDWDDAYANSPHIANAAAILEKLRTSSDAFRAAHDPRPLGRGRIYLPDAPARGLAVFIHGGYWKEPFPDLWSGLAAGAFAQGWAVAMPSYELAPHARISAMTAEVAAAITEAATLTEGPIALTGHSAGGHLAARMVCDDGTLPDEVFRRVTSCVPISPISDLRAMMRTKMNETLGIDTEEALRESPALLPPRPDVPVTTWVGGSERPEFIRQARLLADVWAGLGAATDCVVEPGCNHFTILDGLTRPDSPLMKRLLG
ncbi:alpha/beta hydrolase [Paracoccus caeni]|uniref:Alpha/beta hydrolase n=2 Tax=Paracoccus caeni TaxID=657651 RepID=A0A934SBS7_9RHOB|nr:alpha/beta hydrolase [Paracoccus caeni]